MADKRKVLFFIQGTCPTDKDREAAAKLGAGVRFRNAAMVSDDEPVEHADAVAGYVPPLYRKAYSNPDKHQNLFERGADRHGVLGMRDTNLHQQKNSLSHDIAKAEQDDAMAKLAALQAEKEARLAADAEQRAKDEAVKHSTEAGKHAETEVKDNAGKIAEPVKAIEDGWGAPIGNGAQH